MSASQQVTDTAVCEAWQCQDCEQLDLRSQKNNMYLICHGHGSRFDKFPQRFCSESFWLRNPSSKEEKLVLIHLHLPFSFFPIPCDAWWIIFPLWLAGVGGEAGFLAMICKCPALCNFSSNSVKTFLLTEETGKWTLATITSKTAVALPPTSECSIHKDFCNMSFILKYTNFRVKLDCWKPIYCYGELLFTPSPMRSDLGTNCMS